MPEVIKLNERIPYRRYRKNDNGELKESGYAAVYADEEYITLRAVLHDTDIHSDASAENQAMWMLGDVLEFFFWIPPRKDYYETQVSCNGNKLQIHINEFYVVYDRELEDIIAEYGMTALFSPLWHFQKMIMLSPASFGSRDTKPHFSENGT